VSNKACGEKAHCCVKHFLFQKSCFLQDNYKKHPSAREAKEITIYVLLFRMKLKNRNLYKHETATDLHYANNHTEDVRKETVETETNDIQQLSGNKRIYALPLYRFRRKNTVLKYLNIGLM